MSEAKLAELMKRNRKLEGMMGQRELTQSERDEWEELVRQITELQDAGASQAE